MSYRRCGRALIDRAVKNHNWEERYVEMSGVMKEEFGGLAIEDLRSEDRTHELAMDIATNCDRTSYGLDI